MLDAAPGGLPDSSGIRPWEVPPTLSRVGDAETRDLEFDLQALSGRLRSDFDFAEEMYCALCNMDWRHVDGTTWHGSWRYSAGLIATLRGRGEDYIDFYCTRACAEGTISDRVAAAMAELGWTGTGHDSKAVYALEPSGEQTVWVDGDWVSVEVARREHPELFSGEPGGASEGP
jgi:hypothetical protein